MLFVLWRTGNRKTEQDGESKQSGTFRRPLGHLSHALAKEKLEWWCTCGTQDSLNIKLLGTEMNHIFQSVLFVTES
jgi:hypothetical protein